MGNKKKGKILAVLLSGALIGTQIPGMTVAEGAAGYTGGICGHHPVHTAECGYQEAVPEQPCRHEHTKECYEYETSCVHVHTEECYPLIAIEVPAGDQDTEGTTETQTEWVRGSEPTACIHVCSEDSGCVTKTLNCIHEDKVNADGSITYAVHDASCGCAPAVEGKECTFVCEICSAPEEKGIELISLSETETEALMVQTGIAAVGSTDSELSAKTTETGDEGNDEDETDSETETSTEETPDSDAEMETDEVVTKVQAMIDALPSVSEVEQMTADEQKEVYDKAQDAADAYFDELTEEQQKQVDLTRLMDLMNFFNGQVSTMASEGNGWALSDDGELTITSNDGCASSKWSGNSNITKVIIENGVTSIGSDVFYGCSSLRSITIPDSVTSIGYKAFYRCSSLTEITIPDSVTSIGSDVFYGCSSLRSITIPNSVTSIGSYAFQGCRSLTEITIPNSVTSIGSDAFQGCSSLTEITIPGSVTDIGAHAFEGCDGLRSITIQDGVKSIGDEAFWGCTNLTEEIKIPDSVTSIGDKAFWGCNGLRKVTLPATAPTTVSNDSFETWKYIHFIIPETSIGTGDGQYNLNDEPWNQIWRLNEMVIVNGKSVIIMADVSLDVPKVGAKLPSQADSRTENVTASVSWSPVAEAAAYGIAYTATIKLSANTTATPIGYTFANYTEIYLNGSWLQDKVEVADDGSTLTFTKTYQMPKQPQNSPDISIDYQNETLSTTAGMEYSTDEGENWNDCSADMKVAVLGWDGTEKSVQIRMKETADKDASASTEVTIPARPASPNIQADGSTASSINVQAADVSQEAAVQYQLVADGDYIDSEKWQQSGKFTNLKADTAYTAYARCGATTSSFASDTSSGRTVKTLAAAYTVTIPSEVIAGDSTSKGEAEISVNTSKSFDLGYNGQVQVKVESNGAVSSDGKLTLTRQGASDTLTSAMLVNGAAFTNITNPVAAFTMSNYTSEDAKAAVSFAQPQPTDTTQTVIPAGTYSGTVTFEVSYSD